MIKVFGLVKERRFHIVFLVLISFIIIFWNLGGNSLRDLDEALHAQISKEIINTGDWLIPHIRNIPYLHKPPLQFWLTAFSYQIFGINEFAVRFFPAIFGIGAILITYLLALRLYGNKKIALLSALILLTSSQFVFERGARSGEEDSAFIFFIILFFWLFWLAREKKKYVYFASVSLGLAFLTKGPLTFLYILIIVLFLVINRIFNKGEVFITLKDLLRMLLIGFSIASAWFVIVFLLTGQNFIKIYLSELIFFAIPSFLQHHHAFFVTFFGGDTINRLNINAPGTNQIMYFFKTIKFGFFPWIILCPFALASLVRGILASKKARANELFILLWVFVPLLIQGLFANKSFWWITPVLIPLAIINSVFLLGLFSAPDKFSKILSMLLLAVFVFLAPIQYTVERFTGIPFLEFFNQQQAYRFNLSVNWPLLITLVVLTLAFAFKNKINKYLSWQKLMPGILIGYLLLISFINIVSLAKHSTYKSDMNTVVNYLNGQYKNYTLVIYEDSLYRMQYGVVFAEFPTYSYAEMIFDKWSDYFYLNNIKDMKLCFIKKQNSIAGDLSNRIKDTNGKLFLINNKDSRGVINSANNIEVLVTSGDYLVFKFI